jgi:hypothetical protein
LDDDVLDLLEKINAIRPCMSNVRAEADSAAACARAPESRSRRVVPGVFGLAGASVAAPAGRIGVDQGQRSPCVFAAGLARRVGVRRDGEDCRVASWTSSGRRRAGNNDPGGNYDPA